MKFKQNQVLNKELSLQPSYFIYSFPLKLLLTRIIPNLFVSIKQNGKCPALDVYPNLRRVHHGDNVSEMLYYKCSCLRLVRKQSLCSILIY